MQARASLTVFEGGMKFWAALALSALAACSYAQSPTDAGPRPPCAGAAPVPPYAMPGAAPAVLTRVKDAARWTPPACLHWPRSQFKLVLALAGSFHHDGDAASLLARFGAVSTMRGLAYWSVTEHAWRVLITDAAALAGPEAGRRRADFTAAEMRAGAELYFEQRDNRSSDQVVYRMRVLEAKAGRIVVKTENVSPIRAFFVTLFPPGSLRAAYFLERRKPGTWAFYGLSSISEEASALAVTSVASHVNRAAALYRHFIGVAGDKDPPLAP